MDPYRARSVARYAGALMLVVFGIVLAVMQRSLLAMKADKGGSVVRRPSFRADSEASVMAQRILGPAAVVSAATDLDGDGRIESLAEVSDPSSPPGQTWLSRVAVLSPSPDGGFEVLFDSSRPADLPRPKAPGATWHAYFLTLSRMDLEAVTPAGRPLGHRVEVVWDSRERRYRSRVAAMSPEEVEAVEPARADVEAEALEAPKEPRELP